MKDGAYRVALFRAFCDGDALAGDLFLDDIEDQGGDRERARECLRTLDREAFSWLFREADAIRER